MRRVALASAALAFCLPAQWVAGASAAVACLTAATGRRLGASARLGVAIVASATRLDSTLSQELPHARAGASHGAARERIRPVEEAGKMLEWDWGSERLAVAESCLPSRVAEARRLVAQELWVVGWECVGARAA